MLRQLPIVPALIAAAFAASMAAPALADTSAVRALPSPRTPKPGDAADTQYCYRFVEPGKLVMRVHCRTRTQWAQWGVDIDRS